MRDIAQGHRQARRSTTTGGLVRVSVALSPDVFARFQDLAKQNRSTVSGEIRLAAEMGLEIQDEE